MEIIRDYPLSGVGIVRLAELLVGEPIRRGELVPLPTDVHHTEPIPLTAIYLAGKHRLPKVRVFLDFLAEKFARALADRDGCGEIWPPTSAFGHRRKSMIAAASSKGSAG